MNEFRLRTNGQIITEAEFRASSLAVFPAVLDQATLAENGLDPVLHAPAPSVDAYQALTLRNGVVQDSLGNWVHSYVVIAFSPEEILSKIASSKSAFTSKVDRDVDNIYDAAIGNRGPEYDKANKQAMAYKAAGYTGNVPKNVAGWAAAKGWTATQAADDILLAAARLEGAQDAIRDARLLRKEQARKAATMAELTTTMQAWEQFVRTIRSQLGIS